MIRNYGFVEPIITPEDYVFGLQLTPETLREDGQWDDYLPEIEIQKQRGVETSSCVTFGTLNCIEILYKRKYNQEPNYSERYTAVLADTNTVGTTPTAVCEAIRKQGVIADDLLPFSEDIKSFEDYHSPKPMLSSFLEKGAEWLKRHEFKHDWVFTGGSLNQKQKLLKEALKSSPVGVSVYAWVKEGDLYIKPDGVNDTHWCTLYGYVDNAYWKIFDHYDDTHKKLLWDYDFGFAKRFQLNKLAVRRPERIRHSFLAWLFRNLNIA